MSMMVSICAVFFPRGVLDEILNLIKSVSGGFLACSLIVRRLSSVLVCQHFQKASYLKPLGKFFMEYPGV